MKKFVKAAIAAIVIIAAVFGIWKWKSSDNNSVTQYEYRTDEAATGRISRTIS